VSLLAAVKVKGEGLTTALQALSLVWPRGEVVLAELNPGGGDLALRYGLLGPPNLASVASGDKAQLTAAHLPQFFQSIGQVSLLLAPASAEQTQAALASNWSTLTTELTRLGTDVLVDAGTLVVPAMGNAEVVAAADLGVVMVRPTVDAVVRLLGRLPTVPSPRGGLVVVVVGEGPVTPRQIEQESGVVVAGELPWDREGAAMLMSGSWTQRGLRHSRLLRWARNVAEDLCCRLGQIPLPAGGERPGEVAAAGWPAADSVSRPQERAVR
jgi:hypothetical protein